MKKIKAAISGYGNIGRAVELALMQNTDFELVAIVTRRNPKDIKPITENVKVINDSDVDILIDKIDIMFLCGGSATDLPRLTPEYSKKFNTIDTFDTHAKIPEYFDVVDKNSRENGHISMISCGWDPGLFSLMRVLGGAILPHGESYTFWGKGVSQGHSDAIRRVEGVKLGIQYTVPTQSAVEAVRDGKNPALTTREKHTRECFVVPYEDADREKIRQEIVGMPNYFADYDTTVNFITEEEFRKNHSKMPHGGFVFRTGTTNNEKNNQVMEFSLKLDSNAEFTASVAVAYARATIRMYEQNRRGAITVLDVPPYMLSSLSNEELRKELL